MRINIIEIRKTIESVKPKVKYLKRSIIKKKNYQDRIRKKRKAKNK